MMLLLLFVKLHHLLDALRFPPAFFEGSFPIEAVYLLHTVFSVERYLPLLVNTVWSESTNVRETEN
jgi:hypothetical protein